MQHSQPSSSITLESIHQLLVNLQSRFDAHVTQTNANETALNSQVQSIRTELVAVKQTLALTHNKVIELCNPIRKYYTRITALPQELLTLVLSWLDPGTVFKYRRVCKAFDACLMTKQFSVLAVPRYVDDKEEFQDVRSETEVYVGPWGVDPVSKLFIDFPVPFQEAAAEYLFHKTKVLEITHGGSTFVPPRKYPIPAAFGKLSKVDTLVIASPNFVGPVPMEIWNIPSSTPLDALNISNMELNQELPTSVSQLKTLTVLVLINAGLHGRIPKELAELANLKVLNLYNNRLTGCIPSEIGNLVQLEEMELYSNSLDGVIPVTLGNLVKIQILSLNNNQLRGNIPSELGNLSSLRFLNLRENRLTGPVPAAMASMVLLNYCDLSVNPGLTCNVLFRGLII
ncbi:L domain-like protein [Rhizoclosmatium globosum]|uniref:L domain-like protein n=1 Tax=Rhizoclosmatium globosum TaxID=329046 RepID=A0A1Y2CE38_9FUNG|nr:L domain-like protein [Rhizoclosmatium globosum]|eukprot:ORY45309.1 L domain-like protein [Rhizoclosmatium globosum]